MSMDSMKQHGVFSWNELMTTDMDAAKDFYGELFGWILTDIKPGDMDYTMARLGDRDVAGLRMIADTDRGMPPMWGAYVTVDDVDASAARVESLGGKVHMAPEDIPDIGRFCVISDPQGAVLMLITYSDQC